MSYAHRQTHIVTSALHHRDASAGFVDCGPNGIVVGSTSTSTSSLEERCIEVMSRLNNVGVSCIETGEHQEAGLYFRRALDKASETAFFAIPHIHATFSKPRGEVSKSLYIYQRGEYDEGMHTYSEPCLIDPTSTSLHQATATVLFNVGQLYLRLNDHDEAANAFFRSLQIAQWSAPQVGSSSSSISKPNSPCPHNGVTIMAILHNIGHVQYRSGNYEDAVRTYAKALQLGKGAFQKDPSATLEVAATLNCLGVLYFHLPKAETEKAMELYLESLAIRRAVLGADCESRDSQQHWSDPLHEGRT
jgi:tetratricopeptide (TPR) repeat protein